VRLTALVVALAALVFAAPALADNGGLTPVEPASENARAIHDAYILILFVTGFVFVVVETTLVVFLVRYRRGNRAREAEGPQVRGHTRVEAAWTIVPVLLLAIIVAFIFVKLPEIEDAPAAGPDGSLEIQVEGHQYYWLYRSTSRSSPRTSFTAGGFPLSGARSTQSRAARTTRGSRRSGEGRSRDAAPSSAAPSTRR
jgi:heme/copper-type cytochrome/quinol oxidase subunit 2